MRISTYYSNIATAIGAIALMFGLAAVPGQNAAAVNTSEVDIQAEVYGNSVVFQVDTSRDLLSLNLRIVGPGRFLFEDRIELFGTLEWIPDRDLSDGNYRWEAWVVTANPGVAMRELPAGTSPDITIEHFYDFALTQTHTTSGGFRVQDGVLESPADRRAEDEAPRVRRIAGAILNFLVPSAQAQAFTDDVSITKNAPRMFFNSNLGGSTNWDVGYNEFVGWYVRDLTPNNFNFIIRAGAPSNALVISDNGNIGINTGTPNNRLDVVGGSVLLDNHLTVRNPSSSSVTSLNLNADNNNFVSANSWRIINDASNNSRFEIREGSGAQRLTILQGGNVGIGTTTPSGKLHVQDSGGFQILLSASAAGVQHNLDSYGGQLSIGRADGLGGAFNQFVIRDDAPPNSLTIHDDGNIGVGTSAPAAPLHVQRADNSAQVMVQDTGAGNTTLLNLLNNGHVRFRMDNTATGDNWEFRTTGDGANNAFSVNKVGTPSQEFRVFGGGNVLIAGTLTQGSSRTIKERISEMNAEAVLARLEVLPVHEWSYQATPSQRHAGPMAEDFHAAFGLGGSDKHIAPGDLAGISLAAAKALHERNRELETRISQLEAALLEQR